MMVLVGPFLLSIPASPPPVLLRLNHGYFWTLPPPPLSFLARNAHMDWTGERADGRTHTRTHRRLLGLSKLDRERVSERLLLLRSNLRFGRMFFSERYPKRTIPVRNVVQGIIQGGGRERGLHGLSFVSVLCFEEFYCED